MKSRLRTFLVTLLVAAAIGAVHAAQVGLMHDAPVVVAHGPKPPPSPPPAN